MPLPRIYTFLVAAQEPDSAESTTATRGCYVSFRIRATSADTAADFLRTTAEWAALHAARIEETDDQGLSWWGWWQKEPRLVGRMGRVYFEE